ncbi:MAG: hypothetical protein E7672_02335 [Ruminococcaceae bacterium]|nr:hypothetical protein [Oscillospiraceae bacterium]
MAISEEKVRRFDFKKKPHKPSVLIYAAKYIISFPDLKKRKAVIRKHNMEGIEGKPFILLVNHASLVDLNLMLKSTHPYPVNNVMTLEGFNTYTEPLMRSLGVLGKRKFTTDINLIRNIKYCLHELKTIFVLFPETRYSLDGCTSYLPDSLGGLIKMMKVPCVMLNIKGNFVTNPQWNKKNKKTFVESDMFPIVTADEAVSLSADEIFSRIQEAFVYDDYKWQFDNKIKIDDPNRTNGLHALLYKCPNCGCENETDSAGIHIWCRKCGKKWEQDEYGKLHALEGETEFEHIPDWSRWERECVRREIEDGTYRFEDTVRVETLPNSWKFHKHGEGKLIQTIEGTRIECRSYGKEKVIEKGPLDLYSMHIEYDYLGRGDCVDISTNDDSYWLYLSKRDAITKLSFATEEIYKLAEEKRKKSSRRAEKSEVAE